MDISLLNAGLAAGAALAAVPLILHLLMRQTPKHVIFPALRLIRERQKQSKKRGAKKAHAILEAKIGRTVYHLWRKQTAFDAKKFLAS